MDFTLIAHRGYSSRAPENTFFAFDLALEEGFDNFELDAQISKDGHLVVFHDDTIDRVTNGSGYVFDHTLKELQALDAAAKFKGDGDFSGAYIPTLHEFLGRYAGRAHPHLELKSREADLPAMVADALKTHGWLDVAETGTFDAPGLTVSSFWADQLYRSKVRLPNVRHGWLVNEVNEETVAAAQKLGFDAVYPRAGTARPETVSYALDRGLSVRGWGINDDDDMARIYKSGAMGTTVNWPGEAAAFLDSMT
ncbi:MAG: glycerophosphodiester phosphodiesterase family protein [Chloroflexi bacterium]|nr:glycerophosphodiester phosphodiesterase family protein [Chloroflexota bacterium]